MAAVGGCCGRPESAAAEDADVLGSAAPIVALGGCWPVVALAPAVGPAPASFHTRNLVALSTSVVHGPAPAVPADNAARAQAPSSNVIVFMALSPGCDCETPPMRIPTFPYQPGTRADVPCRRTRAGSVTVAMASSGWQSPAARSAGANRRTAAPLRRGAGTVPSDRPWSKSER